MLLTHYWQLATPLVWNIMRTDGRLSGICLLTVGQQTANSLPIDDWQHLLGTALHYYQKTCLVVTGWEEWGLGSWEVTWNCNRTDIAVAKQGMDTYHWLININMHSKLNFVTLLWSPQGVLVSLALKSEGYDWTCDSLSQFSFIVTQSQYHMERILCM